MDYKKFIEQYGKEKVRFAAYYKFKFCFTNNSGLSIFVGGFHEDIYKLGVEAEQEYSVAELEPESAFLNGKDLGDW